ncbi:S24 family peptidase [Colwellia sp. MSW7]|uniref:S24 family peptidase n=1 Tax=Colwellia maritima TaxID=2912588 RepID=A0ABS9X1U4_9GAMM|nr:S24 family peptidase [Colwellia maritima]MCI2284210.1 S24 family peptidase [Colwellia maritima]
MDGLWETERRLEPINIFNFEQEFGHLMNEEQLARELFVSTSTIKSWLKKQEISAYRTLPFGNKTLNYFSEEQLLIIKKEKNIKDRTEKTRKLDFYEFLDKKDYTFSYKIIFLLAMVNHCNNRGELNIDNLVKKYQQFYQDLLTKFGRAEKQGNPLNKTSNLSNINYLKKSIRENPFEKFERKRFFYQCKDLNIISFDSVLWENLESAELTKITEQMIKDGINYFNKIDIELSREDFNVLLNHTAKGNIAKFVRPVESVPKDNVAVIEDETISGLYLPFYQNLKIACGHFKTNQHDEVEMHFIADTAHSFGKLNPDIHFVATASGNSMNGGKAPIEDGDLLLLEWITPNNAGSISGLTMAIETQDETGDDQYLLRVVKKQANGSYSLIANNPDYPSMLANDQMTTFARLKAVLKDI